jgi:peroxiredoxin
MEEIMAVGSQVALWAIVLTNLLLTLVVIRRLNSEPDRARLGLRTGEPAPNFSAATLTGKTVTLGDLRPRTALLFVAPGCRPCVEALPEYLRLTDLAKSSDTHLVVVSGGDAASTRQMLADAQVTGDIVIAPKSDNRFFDEYRILSTPQFVLLENRRVIMTGAPFIAADDWRTLVDSWETVDANHNFVVATHTD